MTPVRLLKMVIEDLLTFAMVVSTLLLACGAFDQWLWP